jgi:hypothetical protein
MFVTGKHRSRQLKQFLHRLLSDNSQLFGNFTLRAIEVCFPAIDVSRCRRVPLSRLLILAHGALLQEQLTLAVENQDVDSTMHQSRGVNLATGFSRDHVIVFINDIEYFMTDGHGASPAQAGYREVYPL